MVTENSGWNKVEPQNAETTCSCVFIFLIPRVVLAYWTHLNPLGRHPKSSETKTLRLRPWLLRLFVLESLEQSSQIDFGQNRWNTRIRESETKSWKRVRSRDKIYKVFKLKKTCKNQHTKHTKKNKKKLQFVFLRLRIFPWCNIFNTFPFQHMETSENKAGPNIHSNSILTLSTRRCVKFSNFCCCSLLLLAFTKWNLEGFDTSIQLTMMSSTQNKCDI